ncbi:hypothetical protein PybrP1_002000 [[Pythium] brassicae (nom. inval.)]|nr:hypothetical protein PybrP1_002000 [[Pythium] brassicae (nom. inval.)]
MRLLVRALMLALAVAAAATTTAAPTDAAARVRKNWEQLSSPQQTLYLDAVGAAMRSGRHLLFTKIYMDAGGLERVHATCGAPAWYRKWLWGYENMLRSLDESFAAVTLPYWNFFHDSAKRLSSKSTCGDMQGCSAFLTAFGGSAGEDFATPFAIDGEFAAGNCVKQGVAQFACTDASGAQHCEKCIPRGDWDIDKSTFEFGASAFPEVMRHAGKSATPIETLRQSMDTRFHWNLHNLLGGVYETRAAAFDPIFVGHYTMVDLAYHMFQGCSKNESRPALTGTCSAGDGSAVSPSATIPMLLEGTAVEDHPSTAPYFAGVGTTYADLEPSAKYEIDPFLETLLKEFYPSCSRATTPALHWAESVVMPDTNVTAGFAHAMAQCSKSTLTGTNTNDEAPFTAVTCELMARAQNGVFTNFSAPIRSKFQAPAHVLPSCIDVLAALVTDTMQLTVSAECKDAILQETGENTASFATKTNGFAVVTRGRGGGIKYLKAKKS